MNKNSWDTSFRYIVLLVLLVVTAIILWYIRAVFKPLIAAGFLAALLSPLVQQLHSRTKLTRRAAASVVFFVVLFLMIGMLVTVIPSFLNEFKTVFRDVSLTLDQYELALAQPLILGGLPVYLGGLIPTIRSSFMGTVIPEPARALTILQTTSRGFLWFLIILVTTYNLMTDWEKLLEWLTGLAPAGDQADLRRLFVELREVWLGYLRGKVRLIIIMAVIYTLFWSSIGLPGSIFLGLMAGFLTLVPEVGPGFTTIIAMLVAWMEGSNFLPISNGWFALLTGAVFLVLNNFKNFYLQPRILARSVQLNEGLVFVAIIAATMLAGVLGVLIVVPVIASSFVIGRYIHRKLMGLPPFADAPVAQDKIAEPPNPV